MKGKAGFLLQLDQCRYLSDVIIVKRKVERSFLVQFYIDGRIAKQRSGKFGVFGTRFCQESQHIAGFVRLGLGTEHSGCGPR